MDNGDQPATKKDLAELRSELEGKLDGKLGSLEENLRGAIHDAETRLLTAFYSFDQLRSG